MFHIQIEEQGRSFVNRKPFYFSIFYANSSLLSRVEAVHQNWCSGIPISFKANHNFHYPHIQKLWCNLWNIFSSNSLLCIAIWCLLPLPFLNPAWTSGVSFSIYGNSICCEILSIPLLLWETNVMVCSFFWGGIGIECSFLGGKKNWNRVIPVCGPFFCLPHLFAYSCHVFEGLHFCGLK